MMKHNISLQRTVVSIITTLLLLVSCQSESFDILTDLPDEKIDFGMTVQEMNALRTRLDSSYIDVGRYNMDFYIQLNCNEESEIGTYVIPSGNSGRLDPKVDPNVDNTILKWKDLTASHTFYSWNIPWDGVEGYGYEDEKYTPSAEPVTIKFQNSSERNGWNEYKNNSIYEKFIGAKTDSYSYKTQGKYVEMTFHHLVSKIEITNLMLIKSDGVIKKDLRADITFVGLPLEATFYPHSKDNKRPYVGEPIKKSDNDGITYYVENEFKDTDLFYICPEVDFSKIDYKIKLHNAEYLSYNTYYGTFEDVEFVRVKGTDYDQGGDSKILHAGEMMKLNITLIPGIGPGMKVIIDDWNVEKPRESQYHSYPGIYSDAEVKELLDAFLGQKNNGTGTTKEDLERLYEMYGQEKYFGDDPTPKKTFPLYDNVEIGESIFPVDKDYIIDGMGHTITLKTNGGTYGWAAYYNIGPMVDVYLTDPNGNNTIYIDAEGYVCLLNPETNEYERTKNGDNYNRLEPLDGSYKGYDINPVTGEVKKTTFYNWNITS